MLKSNSSHQRVKACHSHQHQDGLHCSCCSPLWQLLVPEKNISTNLNIEIGSAPAPLIFRVGINPKDPSDTTLGIIQTLEQGEDRTVEAVGVLNDLIIATGSYESVKKSMLNEVDEKLIKEHIIHSGHTLLPGLIEPHLHIIPSALYELMIDLGPFKKQELNTEYTIQEVKDRLKFEFFPEYQRGESTKDWWILGRNLDPSLFIDKDKTFNAETLNSANSKDPIFLLNSSMHLAYLNTKAIEELNTR